LSPHLSTARDSHASTSRAAIARTSASASWLGRIPVNRHPVRRARRHRPRTDSAGRQPGKRSLIRRPGRYCIRLSWVFTSAVRDTRLLCVPVAFMTGGWPPRCGLWAGSSLGLIRLQRRAKRPGPPPSFYQRPGLLPPDGDPRLIPLGGLAGGDLHAPSDPVQQISPCQGAAHEPCPGHLGDSRQRPALVLIPARRGRPSVQHPSSSRNCSRLSLHFARPHPSTPAPPGPGRQRSPPPVRRHPRYPECSVISRSLAPPSISSAAANRTGSRRARSAASSPPPSGYLMNPAYPRPGSRQQNS
jgi:hypothetical protein